MKIKSIYFSKSKGKLRPVKSHGFRHRVAQMRALGKGRFRGNNSRYGL